MKSTTELLRESPFFETFAPDDIDALAGHAAMRNVSAGEVILRENEPAEALFMIVAGKVRLSFETSEGLLRPGTPGDDRVLIRTLTEPGRVIGWSAVVEPYHYRDTATAIEDTLLLVFERQWLERRAEENPEFGVELMTRILWVLGNRLREARIRLVASRYEKEALAIRALLEQSASQLSVKSALHKLPIYLESRLTLSDAFQTLELLRKHGDPFEASLARMCLEILENVRKELKVYRRLQQIYEAVSEAPADATPEEVRGRCCVEFRRLFKHADHIIEGEENLPPKSGHIFIMNHLTNHPDNTLPNDFQLTLDTHFVSCMVLRARTVSPFRSHPEADSGRRALRVHCRLGGADARLGARRARARLVAGVTLIELLVVAAMPVAKRNGKLNWGQCEGQCANTDIVSETNQSNIRDSSPFLVPWSICRIQRSCYSYACNSRY
jgi:CRP-like cAMP-binding protein